MKMKMHTDMGDKVELCFRKLVASISLFRHMMNTKIESSVISFISELYSFCII